MSSLRVLLHALQCQVKKGLSNDAYYLDKSNNLRDIRLLLLRCLKNVEKTLNIDSDTETTDSSIVDTETEGDVIKTAYLLFDKKTNSIISAFTNQISLDDAIDKLVRIDIKNEISNLKLKLLEEKDETKAQTIALSITQLETQLKCQEGKNINHYSMIDKVIHNYYSYCVRYDNVDENFRFMNRVYLPK